MFPSRSPIEATAPAQNTLPDDSSVVEERLSVKGGACLSGRRSAPGRSAENDGNRVVRRRSRWGRLPAARTAAVLEHGGRTPPRRGGSPRPLEHGGSWVSIGKNCLREQRDQAEPSPRPRERRESDRRSSSGLPPPHAVLRSKSSRAGRADDEQRDPRRTSRRTCSTNSSSGGSAQWRSSKMTHDAAYLEARASRNRRQRSERLGALGRFLLRRPRERRRAAHSLAVNESRSDHLLHRRRDTTHASFSASSGRGCRTREFQPAA